MWRKSHGRTTNPLTLSLLCSLFFLGCYQRSAAGFSFSHDVGTYLSFRPAKAWEVPGGNKSHWLFATFHVPAEIWHRMYTCTMHFTISVFPNHRLDPIDSIWYSLYIPPHHPLFSLSLSLIYVLLTRRGCRTDLTGQPTARRRVLFLESNIHVFFSLSLSISLVSLKRSWCTVAKENNHDVSRAFCKIDF